jgi:hypothetical protein
MAQLVTAEPGSLTPNFSLFGTGFRQGQQIGDAMANRQALDQKSQAASQLAGTQRLAQSGDPQALQDVAGTQFGNDLQTYFSTIDENQRAEDLRENDVLTMTSIDALSIPDLTERRLFLERKRAQFSADGRDTKNIDGALARDDAGLTQAITMQARQGQDIAERAKQMFTDTAKAPVTTSLQKNLEAAGFVPGTPDYQAEVVKSLNKSGTTINLDSGSQAFSKEMAKGQAQSVALVREQADAAIDANQSLSVLENIDVNTGALEPAKQGIAAFANAFGLDGSKIANVSAGEAFNSEAQRLVLSIKATQKGPQTDNDELTIRKTVSNLGNTKQGNQFIINSARALNNRRIERKDFYDEFLQDSGDKFRNDDGVTADSAWSKFKRDTPMVSAKQRTPEGLPVFYYKFDEAIREAYPDATQNEILELWRKTEKDSK